MKLSSAITVFLLGYSAIVEGKTIVAQTGSYTDVLTAVNNAAQGDTVLIPPGTNKWYQTMFISGITLQGTSTNNTVIVDETQVYSYQTILQLSVTSSVLTRVTGIQFTHGVTNNLSYNNYRGTVEVYGALPYWRIDGCYFNLTTAKCIHVGDGAYGLIDDNVCITQNRLALELDDTGFGDISWATPITFGSSNAIYVESCYFKDNNRGGALDVSNGGRAVFRYNTLIGTYISNHGTETSQRYRSCRYFEIYHNNFTYPYFGAYDNFYTAVDCRGGTALVYSNVISAFYSSMNVNNYRSTDNDPQWVPWFGATGLSGYDSNGPSLLTGTSSATSNKLFVASAAWTTDQWKGCTVYNSNSVSGNFLIGLVSGNDNKTMSFKSSRSVNLQMFFTNGDAFVVHRVYPKLDMPGRGIGDLMSNNVPAQVWPNETLETIYCWSNYLVTVFGAPPSYTDPLPTVVNGDLISGYSDILNGRDFTNRIKPGYIPLTFPYPGSIPFVTNPPPVILPLGRVGIVSSMLP